jgi:hypothetical protein
VFYRVAGYALYWSAQVPNAIGFVLFMAGSLIGMAGTRLEEAAYRLWKKQDFSGPMP